MNQDQNPFLAALKSFVREAQASAIEMLENASYIDRELPNVAMTGELRGITTNMCAALTSTAQTAISELSSWTGGSYQRQELAERSNKLVDLISRDLSDLHDLVMALRAQGDNDFKYMGASILVGESATNILLAYTRAADAVKGVSAAAASA